MKWKLAAMDDRDSCLAMAMTTLGSSPMRMNHYMMGGSRCFVEYYRKTSTCAA
jgi:hypothetical protein